MSVVLGDNMARRFLNKIGVWLLSSPIGNLYFEFLLWLDRRQSKQYLNAKEVAQIIREYSLLGEGVKELKFKINSLTKSKDSVEYNNVLSEIEDLISLTKAPEDSPKSAMAKVLRDIAVKKGDRDINSVTDHAKMIEKRIQDMYELQEHKVQRNLLRQIRKAKQEGNTKLVEELEKEWNTNVRNK